MHGAITCMQPAQLLDTKLSISRTRAHECTPSSLKASAAGDIGSKTVAQMPTLLSHCTFSRVAKTGPRTARAHARGHQGGAPNSLANPTCRRLQQAPIARLLYPQCFACVWAPARSKLSTRVAKAPWLTPACSRICPSTDAIRLQGAAAKAQPANSPEANSPAHIHFRGCCAVTIGHGRSCLPSVALHMEQPPGPQPCWTMRTPEPRLWRQWRTLPSCQADPCQGLRRAQLDTRDKATSLLSNLSIHLRRCQIPRMRPIQPGLVLRGDGAPRPPHRTVALEAAAERDLPHAVAALDALRSTISLNPETTAECNLQHAIATPCAARCQASHIFKVLYSNNSQSHRFKQH